MHEAEPFEHGLGGLGVAAHLAHKSAGLRRQQREVDLLARQQRGHELAALCAETVGFVVRQIDEAAAEVLPETVAAVGGDGRHHLGDDRVLKSLTMQGDVVEADEAQLLAELLGSAAERGRQDQGADLAGARFVEDQLGRHVRGAGLQILTEEAPLAQAQIHVGGARGAHAGDHHRTAQRGARRQVLDDEHVLRTCAGGAAKRAKARTGRVRVGLAATGCAEADLRPADLVLDHLPVGGEVDEVHHLGQLEEAGGVVESGLAEEKHSGRSLLHGAGGWAQSACCMVRATAERASSRMAKASSQWRSSRTPRGGRKRTWCGPWPQ